MKYFLAALTLPTLLIAVLGVEVLLARGNPPPPYFNPSPEVVRVGGGPKSLRYVVMGDSTAAGQGADYESGIAMRTAQQLGVEHKVELVNLAVSGAKIADVRAEQLKPAMALQPDLVLISIGANDVTNLTSPDAAKEDLRQVIAAIRRSGDARVVITGAPDMGSVPRFAQPLRYLAGKLTQRLNARLYELEKEPGVTLVPIALETGPIFRKQPELYEKDKFHPNAKGYAVWVQALNRGLATALSN